MNKKTLVIACGALARELVEVVKANNLQNIDFTCLPASLHLTPQKIPEAMRQKIREHRTAYQQILCLYGDCGTAGKLDEVLEDEGVQRIAGDHCYAFYSGLGTFKRMNESEGATFYLTDYLVTYFESFVVRNLGLDEYPELAEEYFGNFKRVVFLSQIQDPSLEIKAEVAAKRLGLPLEIRRTGLEELSGFLIDQTTFKVSPHTSGSLSQDSIGDTNPARNRSFIPIRRSN